jgi:uncharacterized cupredoxin-like copper-binding protein
VTHHAAESHRGSHGERDFGPFRPPATGLTITRMDTQTISPPAALTDRRTADALCDHTTGRRTTYRRPRAPRALAAVGLAVATAAFAGGCGDDSPGADLPAVEGPVSPRLELTAREMAYEPDAIAVEAGDVEVVLHNAGTILHDLRVEDQPFILEAKAGETTTSDVTLEPGRYELFCSLPGHREAGMTGVVEVR